MTTTRSILIAVLLGGLVAGTLDIGAAVLISGRPPAFILQFIASGLVGKAAFAGGTGTVALGMVLQWVMGLIIAAVYVLAGLRIPELRRLWVAGGLAYGVVVYFVMTYAVVPLSAAGAHHLPSFHLESFLKNLTAMLVFGLIVAWSARARPAAVAG